MKWICAEGSDGQWQPVAAARPADHLGRLRRPNGVQVLRERQNVLIRFDGQHFGQWHSEQVLDEIDGLEGYVEQFSFHIRTGAGGTCRYVRHTAHSAVEARRYVRMVTAVLGVISADVTLKVMPVRLDRLLLGSGRPFDQVVAAWLLDRRVCSPTLHDLFQPRRSPADQGLKIIRNAGGRFTFDAYRHATKYRWAWSESVRRPGTDFSILDDRQLAQSLRDSIATVARADTPFAEIVRGIFDEVNGSQFTEYYRLSLPLAGPDRGTSTSVLMMTKW